jgi:peptidoglycan-binding protein ArfA
MAGSGDAPETTRWRLVSKFYRRPLGLAWLIVLVIVPLLLGAIGYGLKDRARPRTTGPTGALPTLTAPPSRGAAPPVPALSLAPVSITRNGNDITLRGEFPSAKAKSALVDAVIASVGSSANIIDYLGVNPDINALDFSDAGAVFNAAASITDFSLAVSGNTITLGGTAASGDQGNAVERAAQDAWPNLNLVDKIEINGPVMLTETPSPAPGGSPGVCGNLASDIKAVGSITFASGGFSLAEGAEQKLTQVADRLKACPGSKVTINGYAANAGNDAANFELSDKRANVVADFLIARGVARNRLTTKGLGSADPIAGNDTSGGRAKNRRVEIVVS